MPIALFPPVLEYPYGTISRLMNFNFGFSYRSNLRMYAVEKKTEIMLNLPLFQIDIFSHVYCKKSKGLPL